MSKAHPPELKKFMDKKLSLKLNGGRHVQGILRGFDPFMNLVMDDCLEMGPGGQQNTIGMVKNATRTCQSHPRKQHHHVGGFGASMSRAQRRLLFSHSIVVHSQ
uniref:Small nuclear ribonucleoprotein G n=1 Tax=Oryzias latipes TaxID=8090 RepID=A0A3B3HE62_ORYLA